MTQCPFCNNIVSSRILKSKESGILNTILAARPVSVLTSQEQNNLKGGNGVSSLKGGAKTSPPRENKNALPADRDYGTGKIVEHSEN